MQLWKKQKNTLFFLYIIYKKKAKSKQVVSKRMWTKDDFFVEMKMEKKWKTEKSVEKSESLFRKAGGKTEQNPKTGASYEQRYAHCGWINSL